MRAMSQRRRKFSTSPKKQRQTHKKLLTVSAHFRENLDLLMERLFAASPHFVRSVCTAASRGKLFCLSVCTTASRGKLFCLSVCTCATASRGNCSVCTTASRGKLFSMYHSKQGKTVQYVPQLAGGNCSVYQYVPQLAGGNCSVYQYVQYHSKQGNTFLFIDDWCCHFGCTD